MRENKLNWDERDIELAANTACACGGGGPDEGCPACQMYHQLLDMKAPLFKDTTKPLFESKQGGTA